MPSKPRIDLADPAGDDRLSPGSEGDLATEHLHARVVWYYYVGSLTQQEIADRLQLTRLRVNRIIGQARASGAVHIEIRMPLAASVALEEAMKERYQLRDVVIVPTVADLDQQKRVIGEAAGLMLDGLLKSGQRIGVGWGRTLLGAPRKIQRSHLERMHVVAFMGQPDVRLASETFETASELARVLSADCSHMPSLLYYPDEASFTAMANHEPLAFVLKAARAADIGLVTCGDLSDRQTILAATSITSAEVNALHECGAIGEVLGTFIGADGLPVSHGLNQRIMAISPDDLKALPESILAAGAAYKVPTIRAILSRGYVKRLVTDEASAEALLVDPSAARTVKKQSRKPPKAWAN